MPEYDHEEAERPNAENAHDDDRAVVTTVRRANTAEWSAWVKTRGDACKTAGRFHVRIATFHSLRRAGLIAKVREWEAYGLTYTEYELTEVGRAALESV
jgi:hypothetical protein